MHHSWVVKYWHIKDLTYPGKKTHDFQSNPISHPDDYYSNHSMGCLILGECQEGVVEVESLRDVEKYFGKRYSDRKEFDAILSELNKAGSKVFIAPTVSIFPCRTSWCLSYSQQ